MSKAVPWHGPVVQTLAASTPKVFTRQSLAEILRDSQERGQVPKRTSLNAFITVLSERGELRLVELPPVSNDSTPEEERYRPFVRYVWGTPSAFAIALSLRPRSYLSHGSAMVLNRLGDEMRTRIYANQEQSVKPTATQRILQPAIDKAFQNRARTSRYAFRYEGMELVLLNGKNTGNWGVEELIADTGESYAATSLERTLVDITVRPAYAGGVAIVLDAFRLARAQRSDVSLVEGIANTLRSLAHTYPYHQAIGFYLERVGLTSAATAPLRGLGLEYEFYLENQMIDPAFDSEWKIHYPKELD